MFSQSETEKETSSQQTQTEGDEGGHLMETNKSNPQVTVRAPIHLLPHFSSPRLCSHCDQPADKLKRCFAWRGKSCAGVAQGRQSETAAQRALLSVCSSGFIDILKLHGLCGLNTAVLGLRKETQTHRVRQRSCSSAALSSCRH